MKSYHATRFNPMQERKIVWGVLAPYLQKRFSMGQKILEIGCGYGDFINHAEAKERFAIDAEPEMANHVDPKVQFQAVKLPAELNLFKKKMTTIFASNLLEHFDRDDLNRLFKEVYENLEPGGLFISLTPNFKRAWASYFDDFTHITPLTESGLCDWLMAHGFKIKFCHPGLMPFSIKGSRLPVKPFLIKLWLLSPFKPGGKQMLIVAEKA